MKAIKSLVILVLVFGLVGCTVRLVDFTAISTKNVRMPTKGKGPRVAGRDCIPTLLAMFGGTPNMEEAIDKAIEKAGPDYDALVDGVVYKTSNPLMDCYKVDGTPINTKEAIR